MMINLKKIELFRNLSQFDLDDIYYDFHNDFECFKIAFANGSLLFLFRKIAGDNIVSFKFENVLLESLDFFNFSAFKNLTIDNLYRGRFEKDGELIEYSEDGKSYFYVEFDEGPAIELWCERIIIEEV